MSLDIKTHFKSLNKFNRQRLDNALTRIVTRPLLLVPFNIVLIGVNGLFRIKAALLNIAGRLGISKTGFGRYRTTGVVMPQGLPAQEIPSAYSVLLVVEESIPQCLRYRVEQKVAQLTEYGHATEYITWKYSRPVREKIHFYHVVIFYRVPGVPEVMETIEYAKSLGKLVFYDVDDLIFDRDRIKEKFVTGHSLLSPHEKTELLHGAQLYRTAIERCPYRIASTEVLKRELERVPGAEKVYVHANGIDGELAAFGRDRPKRVERAFQTIFYGSGTKTHDADFARVAFSLARLMDEIETLRLTIVGYLILPPELDRFKARIDRVGFLEFEPYLEFLAQADINIAPLEPGIFADCKSEIKWLEAAVAGVPSVVEATATYVGALTDGAHVMLADSADDWYAKIRALLLSPDKRARMVKEAYQYAIDHYGETALGRNLTGIIEGAARLAGTHKGLKREKKRLLLVNVVYPPYAVGGATVVTRNIVQQLCDKYGDQYNVEVFTCDLLNQLPYQVREYAHEGVRVTAVSVPVRPRPDWVYDDEETNKIFARYLGRFQPDLIHFHSVQRLGAGMLEVAAAIAIPYVVTVHDAWWISDRQFLIDDAGEFCGERQADPLVAMKCAEDINESIMRRRYLGRRLADARSVIAVSEYQGRLYRENGVDNVLVGKNGLVRPDPKGHKEASGDTLRIGYTGGLCTHKGYFVLKALVESGNFENLQFRIVDFSLAPGGQKTEKWGSSEVIYVPKFTGQETDGFYAGIDVLIAPSIWPESYGLVTREAALRGKWVVAANAGALAEDLTEGINAHIYEMGDTQGLRGILERMNNDHGRYKRCKTEPPTGISTVAEQVDALVGIYRRAMEGDAGVVRDKLA